jgi:hypothetical protein
MCCRCWFYLAAAAVRVFRLLLLLPPYVLYTYRTEAISYHSRSHRTDCRNSFLPYIITVQAIRSWHLYSLIDQLSSSQTKKSNGVWVGMDGEVVVVVRAARSDGAGAGILHPPLLHHSPRPPSAGGSTPTSTSPTATSLRPVSSRRSPTSTRSKQDH